MSDIFNLGGMIFRSELLAQERNRRISEKEEKMKQKEERLRLKNENKEEYLLLSKKKRIESLKTKLFCVYVLIHNNAPYYVGVSSDITKRISGHLKSKIKRPNYKLYSFMNDNNIVDIDYYIIDDNISFDDIEFWETHYINLYKYYGFNLMNVSSIGGRGITH